jgi:hypothetical protein
MLHPSSRNGGLGWSLFRFCNEQLPGPPANRAKDIVEEKQSLTCFPPGLLIDVAAPNVQEKCSLGLNR